MSDQLRIGLIGCGRAALRLHLPALIRSRNTRLVAAADAVRSRADAIAETVRGCAAFDSAEALLQERISGVIIATPPCDHVATAMIALEAGVSVLVEKPLAPSAEELAPLEQCVAASSGSLMMGFNRRYWEPARQLHELLTAPLDSDVAADLTCTTDADAWDARNGTSDPLEDIGTHQLDLLRFLFDRDIISVSARWIDDGIQIRVALDGGVLAEARATRGTRYVEQIEVRSAKHRYWVWAGSPRVVPARGAIRAGLDVVSALARRVSGAVSPLRRSYDRQLEAFAASLRAGSVPTPGFADGVAAVRAVDAARRSAAADGQEIRL